jgi:hypothetical protein
MANPKVFEPRLCACCGNEFIPKRKDQTACTPAHAAKARKQRFNAKSFRSQVLNFHGERCMWRESAAESLCDGRKLYVMQSNPGEPVLETALVLCNMHAKLWNRTLRMALADRSYIGADRKFAERVAFAEHGRSGSGSVNPRRGGASISYGPATPDRAETYWVNFRHGSGALDAYFENDEESFHVGFVGEQEYRGSVPVH